MTRFYCKYLPILATLFLMGCASNFTNTVINSTITQTQKKVKNKLFIIISAATTTNERGLPISLSEHLELEFNKSYIKTKSFVMTGLELNDIKLESELLEFSPEHILQLNQKEILFLPEGYIFEGKLIETATNNLIWNGIITTRIGLLTLIPTLNTQAASTSIEIVNDLKRKGLISQ